MTHVIKTSSCGWSGLAEELRLHVDAPVTHSVAALAHGEIVLSFVHCRLVTP